MVLATVNQERFPPVLLSLSRDQRKKGLFSDFPLQAGSLGIDGVLHSWEIIFGSEGPAEAICSKQADYVLAVKDNQKNIHDQLKWFFSDIELPSDEATGLVQHTSTFDKKHGRMERRDYLVSRELDWMGVELKGFPHVKSIGMVQYRRTAHGKTGVERRYYISSLKPDVDLFAKSVRSHWGIENKVHWVLDMVFEGRREPDQKRSLCRQHGNNQKNGLEPHTTRSSPPRSGH